MSVKQLTLLSAVLFTLGCSVSGHSDSDKASKKAESTEAQTAQTGKASEGSNAKLDALLNRKTPSSSSASAAGKGASAGMATPAMGGKKAGSEKEATGSVSGRGIAISADMLTPEVIAEMKKMIEAQKAAEAEGKESSDKSKDEASKK